MRVLTLAAMLNFIVLSRIKIIEKINLLYPLTIGYTNKILKNR